MEMRLLSQRRGSAEAQKTIKAEDLPVFSSGPVHGDNHEDFRLADILLP